MLHSSSVAVIESLETLQSDTLRKTLVLIGRYYASRDVSVSVRENMLHNIIPRVYLTVTVNLYKAVRIEMRIAVQPSGLIDIHGITLYKGYRGESGYESDDVRLYSEHSLYDECANWDGCYVGKGISVFRLLWIIKALRNKGTHHLNDMYQEGTVGSYYSLLLE
jgi:hypothetical protein